MTAEAPAVRVMRMFIEGASEGNPELRRLLQLSVLRVVQKAVKRPPEEVPHLRPFPELAHISDWLKAALVNDAPWLRNVDDKGRPKKLMKFGSLDAMVREADKDMRRRSRKVLRSELPDGSEEIVATLEGGYSIVRMLTVEALDAETAEMQHCIGQGAYDDRVADGKTLLLSLRDRNGKAHATIEVVDDLVEQVQGKQNKPPKDKYIPAITSYFRTTDYNWSLFGDGTEGFVIDIHGTVHSCDDLPDECVPSRRCHRWRPRKRISRSIASRASKRPFALKPAETSR
ncbi:PcfJ domain-containing protein [Pararhizobium sp. BT-229]|uniref:PcfJ domain-containing protein n=1 Tax=Pararhizobium sp. BT-229 TaxID=2986923 RepID=UPI0021F71DFF|nr:PcfJ domain-containing protein [Pararhizobium sp. BT-229]MCV9964144.1 PcfJ domain-containing protein [Pararhizobium sp. BT-229]